MTKEDDMVDESLMNDNEALIDIMHDNENTITQIKTRLAEMTAERDEANLVILRFWLCDWKRSLASQLDEWAISHIIYHLKGLIDAHGNPVGATNQDIVIERIVNEAKGESPQEADDDPR